MLLIYFTTFLLLLSICLILKKYNYTERSKKTQKFYLIGASIWLILTVIYTILFYKGGFELVNKIFLFNRGAPFPLILFSGFSFIILLYEFINTSKEKLEIEIETLKNQKKMFDKDLSLFTQRIVVDRWEDDVMKYPQLNKFYQETFSQMNGTKNGFLSQKEWKKLNIPVKYVPFKDNEFEWHYSAKCIQEMVNIIRMFNLEEKYKLGNKEDLEKSLDGEFGGWIVGFRMFLNNPLVRNVWEQYKSRHVNPKFTAWIEYYVIKVIDENPDYFRDHYTSWQEKTNKYLNFDD